MFRRLQFIVRQKSYRIFREIPFIFSALSEEEGLAERYGLPITRLDIGLAIVGIILLLSYGFK